MFKLKDIIDLINMICEASICIYTKDHKVFKYIEDDIADELNCTVKSIDIYNDLIEICIGD